MHNTDYAGGKLEALHSANELLEIASQRTLVVTEEQLDINRWEDDGGAMGKEAYGE